ncbi:uncharacterized protein G2W53_007916 [Senna tora]|uniref:Uncharacterized protein n=1 Tax=Senna tora TaxID=362788 RepID=A0A834X886_9FABA|nr:uncharacterized protein G2W53_007916 [Senna tora]
MAKIQQKKKKNETEKRDHRTITVTYENYAFAKVIDRGGVKGITSGFKWPIVVIERDPLEGTNL